MAVIKLTSENFNKEIKQYAGVALIDFYADWCGPCKVLSPRLAKLAKEFDGKIVIYKVNIDKEQQMARAFGISSIPALLWCPSKGEPAFTQGALPEDALRKRIEEFLLK